MFKNYFEKIKFFFENLYINKIDALIYDKSSSSQKPALKKRMKYFYTASISGVLVTMLLYAIVKDPFVSTIQGACKIILDSSDDVLRDERRVIVEAKPVIMGTMTKRIPSVGRMRASESVVIRAETDARIKEILFTEGSTVEKDQIIITFENNDLKARLRAAEVRYDTAKLQFARTQKLHAQKFGSPKEYEKDKGALDEAEANVMQLRADLDKTIIKAPFAGQIGLLNFHVGSYVARNTDLVSLVQSNPMKIDFKIAGQYAKDVGAGQSVELFVDSFKDKVFTGHVEGVDSKIDEESNSIAIRATLPNDFGDLIPGLFASVSLIIGERVNAMMVEESAVKREGINEFVWVVHKGKAQRKFVRTGVRENNVVEIVNGLSKDDLVVTTGHVRLQRDGTKVKVSNEALLEKKQDAQDSAEKRKEENPSAAAEEKKDAKETTAAQEKSDAQKTPTK